MMTDVCTILTYYCSRSSNEFGSDLEENFFVRVIFFFTSDTLHNQCAYVFYKAYENSLLWSYTSAPAGA